MRTKTPDQTSERLRTTRGPIEALHHAQTTGQLPPSTITVWPVT